jgi:hypothetical protein
MGSRKCGAMSADELICQLSGRESLHVFEWSKMTRSTHARSSDAAPPPRPRRLAVLALALAHVAGWLPLSCAHPTRQQDVGDTPPRSWGKLIGLLVGGFAAATFVALSVRAVLHWALVARDAQTAARRPVRRSTSGPPPLPRVPEEAEPLEACLLVHVQELPPTSPPQRAPSRREGMMTVLLSAADASPTA